MPLNKNINEAVQAAGVTLLASSAIQDFYQITAHAGLQNFVDLNNSVGGDSWHLDASSWQQHITDNHVYNVYGVTNHDTNQLKYMFLQPNPNNDDSKRFTWNVEVDIDGHIKIFQLIANAFSETGDEHVENSIPLDKPLDFDMLITQNIIRFYNISSQGFIFNDENSTIITNYSKRFVTDADIKQSNKIVLQDEYDLATENLSFAELFKEFALSNITQIVCNTELKENETPRRGTIYGKLSAENSNNLSALNTVLTENNMYVLMPSVFNNFRTDWDSFNRFIITDNLNVASNNIQAEIQRLDQEKAKLNRRKDNKIIYKEVGDEVHIVGSKRTPTVKELRIPNEINGKRVTEIESAAFSGNNSIGILYLPKYLKKIGKDAFYNSNINVKFNRSEMETYANKIEIGNLDALNTQGINFQLHSNTDDLAFLNTKKPLTLADFRLAISRYSRFRNLLNDSNASHLFYDE